MELFSQNTSPFVLTPHFDFSPSLPHFSPHPLVSYFEPVHQLTPEEWKAKEMEDEKT